MNFCFKAAKITGGVLSFFWPQIFKNNWERQLQKHKKKTCEKFSDIAAFFTFNEFFEGKRYCTVWQVLFCWLTFWTF